MKRQAMHRHLTQGAQVLYIQEQVGQSMTHKWIVQQAAAAEGPRGWPTRLIFDGIIRSNMCLQAIQHKFSCGSEPPQLRRRKAAVDIRAKGLDIDLIKCCPQIGS